MKPTALFIAGTLLISCLVAAANPAHAICGSPRIVTTNNSYIVTSGCEAVDCGTEGIGVTDNLAGTFWALGFGDPISGLGIDSGDYSALGNWLAIHPGYRSIINTTWARSTAIDGCIDFSDDPRRCMVILLTDRHPDSGDGVFALMTHAPDDVLNYDFEWSRGDITLSTMGRLTVTGATILENDIIEVAIEGIDVDDINDGLYLDPACGGPSGVVLGYEAFVAVRPNTAMAPDNSDAGLWRRVTEVLPLGRRWNFQVDCSKDESAWLRAGLVFDSGYRTPFLSEQSTRLECKRVLAEPEDPSPRKPRSRGLPRRKPTRGQR